MTINYYPIAEKAELTIKNGSKRFEVSVFIQLWWLKQRCWLVIEASNLFKPLKAVHRTLFSSQ